MVVDVTGPAGFSERTRDNACTSSKAVLPKLTVPGKYTITVTVTAPGEAPKTQTHDFQLIAHGA